MIVEGARPTSHINRTLAHISNYTDFSFSAQIFILDSILTFLVHINHRNTGIVFPDVWGWDVTMTNTLV